MPDETRRAPPTLLSFESAATSSATSVPWDADRVRAAPYGPKLDAIVRSCARVNPANPPSVMGAGFEDNRPDCRTRVRKETCLRGRERAVW